MTKGPISPPINYSTLTYIQATTVSHREGKGDVSKGTIE